MVKIPYRNELPEDDDERLTEPCRNRYPTGLRCIYHIPCGRHKCDDFCQVVDGTVNTFCMNHSLSSCVKSLSETASRPSRAISSGPTFSTRSFSFQSSVNLPEEDIYCEDSDSRYINEDYNLKCRTSGCSERGSNGEIQSHSCE